MSDTGTSCTTPLGRIVWGHPVIPQHKTDEHNKKLFNDDGTPQMEVSYGLAIPKAEFQAVVWPCMAAEAAKGYPSGTPAKFSWKWLDGDGVDPKGKPYPDRAGYAGCFILAISTRFEAPPVMQWNEQQNAYYQISDIKCGDYVQANVEFVVNVPKNVSHTPSLYVNPKLTLLWWAGDEIKSAGPAADPTQVFGAAPVMPAAPAGARAVGAVPNAGGGMMGQMQQPAMQQPAMQQPAMQQPAMQQPAMQQPAMQQPAMQQPAMQQPAMQQPAMQQQLPPPALGFVDQSAGNGGMPGMPPAR